MNANQEFKVNGITYRLQSRACGKPGCKCTRGQQHGPYWYGYSDLAPVKYFGKELPEHVSKYVALLKQSKPKISKARAQIEKRREDLERKLRIANNELHTLRALENGDLANAQILKAIGLSEFAVNGHK